MIIPPLGWLSPEERTKEQQALHNAILAQMPKFSMPVGATPPVGTKVLLTDSWKHPLIVQALGYAFTGVRQVSGSCLPAGSPVRMWTGEEKPIEDVKVGDAVITHRGHARQVTHTMNRRYTGDMFTFRVTGFPFPLTVTADHEIATAPKWMNGEIQWKRADEIEIGDRMLIGIDKGSLAVQSLDVVKFLGDKVVILDELMKDNAYSEGNAPNVPNVNFSAARSLVKKSGIDWKGRVKLIHTRNANAIFRHVPICPSLGRLIGLYLAEGGCHDGRITFTFNATEEALAAEVLSLVRGLFGVDGELESQADRPTVLKVRIQNQTLAEVFKALVPGNVYSKRIPGFFFRANEDIRIGLLLGWLDGDGHVGITRQKKNVRITGVTVCEGLARDMTTLALSCGLRATCTPRKARKQSRKSFSVDLVGKKAMVLFPAVAHRAVGYRFEEVDARITPHGYGREVKAIDVAAVDNLPVFDFEVAEDHSFVANGLVVHNCVWAGGLTAGTTLNFIEHLAKGDLDQVMIPHMLPNYGKSRQYGGLGGTGSGSFGSTFAKSAEVDGSGDARAPGMPSFTMTNMFCWGEATELKYSNVNNIPADQFAEGKKHLWKSVTECQSFEDVRESILNGYPVTRAFNFFCNPGTARVKNGRLVGTYNGRGGHQESWLGYEHDQFGEWIFEMNQWGLDVYGEDPAGGPRGGCWFSAADVDAKIRSSGAEIYKYSQWEGYPTQKISWMI